MPELALVVLVLRFINLFAAALVAGGQVCVLLVIMPVKRQFPTVLSVQVHNAMLGHQIDYYMKPSGIVSGVTAILIVLITLVWLPNPSVLSAVFYLAGMVGTAGVVILSRFFNVVTNRIMEKWSLDAIPDNYPQIRQRWDLVHTLRASCGVLGLSGYLLGTLTAGFGAVS